MTNLTLLSLTAKSLESSFFSLSPSYAPGKSFLLHKGNIHHFFHSFLYADRQIPLISITDSDFGFFLDRSIVIDREDRNIQNQNLDQVEYRVEIDSANFHCNNTCFHHFQVAGSQTNGGGVAFSIRGTSTVTIKDSTFFELAMEGDAMAGAFYIDTSSSVENSKCSLDGVIIMNCKYSSEDSTNDYPAGYIHAAGGLEINQTLIRDIINPNSERIFGANSKEYISIQGLNSTKNRLASGSGFFLLATDKPTNFLQCEFSFNIGTVLYFLANEEIQEEQYIYMNQVNIINNTAHETDVLLSMFNTLDSKLNVTMEEFVFLNDGYTYTLNTDFEGGEFIFISTTFNQHPNFQPDGTHSVLMEGCTENPSPELIAIEAKSIFGGECFGEIMLEQAWTPTVTITEETETYETVTETEYSQTEINETSEMEESSAIPETEDLNITIGSEETEEETNGEITSENNKGDDEHLKEQITLGVGEISAIAAACVVVVAIVIGLAVYFVKMRTEYNSDSSSSSL